MEWKGRILKMITQLSQIARQVNNRWRGLLTVALVAYIATQLNQWLAPYFQVEALTLSILLGITLANILKLPKALKPGIDYALKTLLMYGIVLLGFKLNFKAILNLGPMLLLGVIAYMAFVFLVAYGLNRWLKLSKHLATLIAVGSSICGAAAVVALAPSIDASEEDAVLAVSIVSFLGAIGVVVYALLAGILPIGDLEYGIWAGLTLHGVAHALAGAFARSSLSGEIGTFVKMTRVLMLVPVSLILSSAFHPKDGAKKRAKVPNYVWGFILAGAIHAAAIVPAPATKFAQEGSNILILLAMTAMGLSVNFKDIADKGLKAVLLGSLLFIVTAAIALGVLLMF
jgi:uncharacterized integral membrane protein (TIGR00698 family)